VIGEVEFAMKIRMHHSREAGEENRKYMMLGCRKWAKNAKYGPLSIFSSVERKFGEDLRARSPIGLLAEAMQKMCIYL